MLFISIHCHDDWILDLVTSGPLEILLIHHGESVIDRFINAAQSHPVIKEMLCGAIIDRAPETVQQRVNLICDSADDQENA